LDETDGGANLIKSSPVVLNVGLEVFYRALASQGVKTVQVSILATPKLGRKYADALSELL
jgi:hypothetical protein